MTATGRRERSIAHEAAQDDLPLEVREPMGDRLQHPVTDLELLRLAPAPWGHDLVHRSAGELGPPVAGWLGDGEGHEAVGAPVVVPAHHLAGHDRAELGVIAQHLDRQLLVDDLDDLLLRAVGEGDSGAVRPETEHTHDLLAALVAENTK